jgi:hypothetical protein
MKKHGLPFSSLPPLTHTPVPRPHTQTQTTQAPTTGPNDRASTTQLRIVSAGYLIGNTAEFYLNGAKLTDAKSQRGMNVVYLNANDDAMEGSEKFDTYGHHDQDDKMLEYLKNIPSGRIVMISAKDEAAKKCDSHCETGLKLIGATIFPTIFRGSYIAAGRKDGAVIVNKQDGTKKIDWSGSVRAPTPKFADGICSGTDGEYSKSALQSTNNDAGAWYTHAGLATGICSIRSVEKCAKICADVEGCNYFSMSLTQSCYACFVHKTCANPSTAIGYGYTVYGEAGPTKPV